MNRQIGATIMVVVAVLAFASLSALAYPPGVGILAKNRSCVSCHPSNGPWSDEGHTVIDILDAATRQSLKGPDGRFVIEVMRGQTRTVLTVLGRTLDDPADPPKRNAWLYVDTSQIATSSLSKFAPGWEVNLPMACRIVGDQSPGVAAKSMTSLPMTIRPTDAARDAEVELQVMITSGESVKGKADQGLVSNYFMRRVWLKVVEP